MLFIKRLIFCSWFPYEEKWSYSCIPLLGYTYTYLHLGICNTIHNCLVFFINIKLNTLAIIVWIDANNKNINTFFKLRKCCPCIYLVAFVVACKNSIKNFIYNWLYVPFLSPLCCICLKTNIHLFLNSIFKKNFDISYKIVINIYVDLNAANIEWVILQQKYTNK